jgi:hypothetical protein
MTLSGQISIKSPHKEDDTESVLEYLGVWQRFVSEKDTFLKPFRHGHFRDHFFQFSRFCLNRMEISGSFLGFTHSFQWQVTTHTLSMQTEG